MKKSRVIIGLAYSLIVAAVLLFAYIAKLNQYSTYLVMENDGSIISTNYITKNLFNSKMKLKDASYDAVDFQASDIIYKKMGKYYIGEDKALVNMDYPVFVNNGSSILNLTGEMNLITDSFETVPSYSGLYITEGLSYNPDMEQAYREKFILTGLANGLFINGKPITVKGSFFVEETIPANSVIRFMENEIRYYSLKGTTFYPSQIQPLSSASVISIDQAEYSYYDFLERLGIYEKADLLEHEKNNKPTPVSTVNPTPTQTPTPSAALFIPQKVQNAPKKQDATKKNKGKGVIKPEPAPSITALPTSTPDITKIPENQEALKQVTPTPVIAQNHAQIITPRPALPAEQPQLPGVVPTSQPVDNLSENPADEAPTEDNQEEGNKNWKKPVVNLNAFTTSVYSIMTTGMEIENSEYLYRTGVGFSIYQGTKLVMKKAFSSSGDVKIAPLKPDSDYHIVVEMDYYNQYGRKESEKLTEADVHTKPLSALVPLQLNWTNGQIYSNKLQLKELIITNAVNGTIQAVDAQNHPVQLNTYIETVQFMNRFEVVITSKIDSNVKYTLPLAAKELTSLRMGNPVTYESGGKILSNTEYYYEFRCYDRFGNVLPIEGSALGNSHTCKQPPKADITVLKNEVKNIELSISMENKDQADITEGTLSFSVYDKNNNPVVTTITRKDKDGNTLTENECSESHPIDFTENNIQFLDLLDSEVYEVRVFCSYNINDNQGIYPYAVIGEMSFTTIPIASLGYAFFDVTVQNIKDNSTTVEISLDTSRTDSRLTKLISNMEVAFVKADSEDGTGMNVTYHKKGSEVTQTPPDAPPPNNGLVSLTEEEVELMKAGDGSAQADKATYVFQVEHLMSCTEYKIKIVPKVKIGTKGNEIFRDIDSYYSPDSFKTMKKTPVIDIDAIYASSSFIKLYGVSVNDPDGAVISYPVTVSVYDDNGKQLDTYELQSKDKVTVIDVSKLERDKTYTFRFFAHEYNNGYDMTTYRKNYELYYSDLFEKKEYLKITTQEAITGSIDIQQLNQFKLINSVEIPAKNMTSYNSKISLYLNYRFGSNGQTKAKFSMEVDFGQEQWNSFQIGYSYVNRATKFEFYTTDPEKDTGAVAFASLLVDGLTRSTENCRWTDIQLFHNNMTLTGKQKIYVVATTPVSGGGIDCLWGIRFHKAQVSDSQHYFADMKTLVSDAKNELGDKPSYMIKVFEDGNWVDTRRHEWTANADGSYTLRMYEVAPDKTETLVDIKQYSGKARVSDTDFYYEVEKGYHNYRFELWAVVFDYEIQLDKEEFNTEKSVIGIRTADELADVRYNITSKYYVLNDITFPLNWNSITSNLTFDGELDFRGHTLTYNSTANLIGTIGYYGVLKNLVFTYGDGWGSDIERKTDRIVTYNYGRIQNILVRRNNGNVAQTYKTDSAAICHTNYESGVIENFVVKQEDPFITTNYSAGVCVYNKGMIRNGYIYGAPMKMTEEGNLTLDQFQANNVTGGIVAVNRQTGIIENVYSLMDIQTREVKTANDYVFGLVGINDGTLVNSFYTGNVYYGGKTRTDFGPAYRNRYPASSAVNTYYYSDIDYGKTTNKRISKVVLYDTKWYDRMFNQSNNSISGQFDLKPVQLGYYPQVVWPDTMPAQEYNPLPDITAENQIKLIDTNVIEQGENDAKAVITFKNPDKFKIESISLQWLNAEILSQDEDGDFYRVTVRLTQAKDAKCYSSYNITSFSYSLGFSQIAKTVEYAVDDQPKVDAEFYKPITTTTEWSAMKDDYQQNYRLYADLNFQYLDPKVVVLPANVTLNTGDANFNKDAFAGKLDGNGHKISFLDTGTYGYVIGKLKGTIKNLTIENLDATKGNSQFKGFIGRLLEGSVVDNVHVLGMSAVSYEQCGAIAGDAFAAKIMNSSAHDIKIQSSADGNYAQFIGGLVGKHRVSSGTINGNLSIQNCYVDGLDIKVLAAGDCGGVGGLIGFIRASAEISHVYVVNGSIDTVYKNAGGLIGAIDTFTNSESSLYLLKDYYVDVNVTSITKRCGGIVGFSMVQNGELEEHGLVLGNTVTSLPNPEEVGRYYGYNKYTSSKIYGYELSVLNGKLNNDSSLLTYNSLCNPETYQKGGILNWDNDFVINAEQLSKGIMPKLDRTDKTAEVPYQKDYYLEKNPITIKSITSKNYSSGELYTVQIIAEHSPNVMITGATFNGLVAADLGGAADSVIITNNDNTTTLEYVLGIEGYYDTYYLTGINYSESPNPQSQTQSMYLSVGIEPQYLKIGSSDEWNKLMAKDMFGQKRYNIQIIGDLDFSEGKGAAKDVIVNHIMGSELEKGKWKTIKGIDMETGDSLIKAAYGDISYLNFDSITLTKSKETNPTPVNSYGIVSAVTGDMHDVSFHNIKLDAYNSSYAGIMALSYGKNYNITLDGVTVYNKYGTIPAKRAVGGLAGRVSGSGGAYNIDASDLIVQGADYVGGIIGTQEDGKYIWNINVDNAVVSSVNASYHYVGGIVGYADSASLENIFGNCTIKHSLVAGSIFVGGIAGLGSLTGNSHYSGTESDKYQNRVEKVFVVGTGYYTGGAAGQGVVNRTQVRDSNIYGVYNIGGLTGNGSAIFDSCLDSTISTVFDKKGDDFGNTAFVAAVDNKIAYYEGMSATAAAKKKSVYEEAVKVLKYFKTDARISAWSGKSFTGNNNSRIGGISGRTLSISNCIAANCQIGAYGAVSVGGIVARTELSSYNTGPYRIAACGTQNCKIYGAEDIGGIVGSHLRSYIESCYSNADVTASLDNSGGIAGRVKATNLYSLSETPYINHVFYTGTVTAPNYVAGIVGKMEQDLYNINQGWLMAGNVKVTNPTGIGDYFLNKQFGDVGGIEKSLVYENSLMTIDADSRKATKYYLDNPVLLLKDDIAFVTTAELKDKATYTDKMSWSTDTGILSSNYSTRYWSYKGLANGYMPYSTSAPANNYDMVSSVRILRYQEGYQPDPEDPEKAAVDSSGSYLYRYESYNGGIPVPGSGAGVIKAKFAVKAVSAEVPRAEFYTVDADKLNIEFNKVNENASFTVMANGSKVAECKVNQRTFTLNYDFKTELTITVTDGIGKLKYTVWPEDVSRNVMTWNADYYYITSDKVDGSNPKLEGQFINLYTGHALDVYGSVYDVESGKLLRTVENISLADQAQPLNRFDYDGYQIATYKNYSVVGKVEREKLRLYVKNEELSAISSALSMITDSLILDNYNGSKYCSVLSLDGTIVDMTDSQLKLPEKFDNADIQYMTNNINSTSHIILVRYYDGAVAGFNYITGELLPIDSPRGTTTDMVDENGFAGRSRNALMTNFTTLYMNVMEFATNLEDIGWADVNGSNLVSGDAVSSENGKINEDDMPIYTENTFVLDDGTVVGQQSVSSKATLQGTAAVTAVPGAVPNEDAVSEVLESLAEENAADSLTDETKQSETDLISSIQAAINVIEEYGATQEELNQITTLISGLSDRGISEAVIKSLKEALHNAASKPESITQKKSSADQDNSVTNKDNSVTDKGKPATDKDQLASDSDKASDEAAAKEVNKKSAKEARDIIQKTGTKGKHYVPVYDSEKSKYVLYDEKELLTKKDKDLKTMDDKVEESGHMIDYRAKQRADIEKSDDDNIYGFILLAAAIVGILLLISSLLLRKNKEAKL